MMKLYGLIGNPLEHSFSKKYFSIKFEKEQIDARYELFELDKIEQFTNLIAKNELSGLNVTIPYKEEIISYLDELDDTAQQIGAVNVIRFIKKNGKTKLKGYNSDTTGFRNSILPFLKDNHRKALVLGSGGASKAIQYALKELQIDTQIVSRTNSETAISYNELTEKTITTYDLIINTTPLGMFPKIDTFPNIPYQYLTEKHLLFDAVYNPATTLFMKKGIEKGALAINGESMLIEQAEEAWRIWNDNSKNR